jgi:hypothetical protein
VHGLQRTRQRYGMVTMCIGTGMGAAGLFEAIQLGSLLAGRWPRPDFPVEAFFVPSLRTWTALQDGA